MQVRPIVTFVMFLVCWNHSLIGVSQGQTKRRDFSGSWMLDETKEKPIRHGRSSRTPKDLEIAHHEPEIRIVQKIKDNGTDRLEELVYYTDGRGELNVSASTATGKEKVKSHTQWEKDRLLVKYSVRWQLPGDIMYFDVEETWELTADGKVLIHTTKLGNPQSAFHKSLVLPEVMEVTRRFYERVSAEK